MKTLSVAVGLSLVFASAAFASPEVGWTDNGVPMTLQWGSVGAAAIASDGASGAIVAYRVCRQGVSLVIVQRVDQAGAVLWGEGVGVCAGTWTQYSPQIVADNAGGAIIMWSDYRSGLVGLYAQRVDAAGTVQWGTDGIAICTAAGSPSGPDLRSDGSGGALVAWADSRSGNPAVYVQRVDFSGLVQWNADGMCVCSESGGKSWVKVVADSEGGALVAWSDGRAGSYDVYAQRVDAAGVARWALNGVPVCTAYDTQGMPEMMADDAGGAIVAWSDYRSGQSDIYAQRVSADGICQWTVDGVAVCEATSTQYYLALVSDGASGAVIVWEDYRSGNYDIYAQRLNPEGSFEWTADGIPLCTASGAQSSPKIILDGTHETIVAWRDSRSGNSDIYAQRVDSSGAVEWAPDGLPLCAETGDQTSHAIVAAELGGVIAAWLGPSGGSSGICAQWADTAGALQWATEGVSVCRATGNQVSARVTADGAGGAIVTWEDTRSGSSDIYAQRVNAWGIALWAASGAPVCLASGGQGAHAVIPDGAGGAIVAWEDGRSGARDIYAQRIDASGAALWALDGVVVCSATGDQYYAQLVSDGAGGAIVTWNDARDGTWTDIYAQRVNGSGAVQWTPDGVPLCQATRFQLVPQIASDGAGGAIVTWMDYRAIEIHAYAQRVNSSGAVVWAADGIPLCTAAAAQTMPGVVPDGAGGAFFTWVDKRGGSSTTNIYAQRVDASGLVLWSTNGVSVCSASGNQYVAEIVSDGAGGAIIVWQDYRAGDYDIYGQRIGASGIPQWTADGVPLCIAANDQTDHSTASDGAGGAIVAWVDKRDGGSDIYAQRVNPSGIALWPTGGVAVCTEASTQQHPDLAFDADGGAIVSWWDSRCASAIYALRVHSSGETTDAPPLSASEILQQNYPNPFNPRTAIRFYLPEARDISLDVFDIAGAHVATLAAGRMERGHHEVIWDGKNDAGASCASGVYFSRLTAGKTSISRKMLILR